MFSADDSADRRSASTGDAGICNVIVPVAGISVATVADWRVSSAAKESLGVHSLGLRILLSGGNGRPRS